MAAENGASCCGGGSKRAGTPRKGPWPMMRISSGATPSQETDSEWCFNSEKFITFGRNASMDHKVCTENIGAGGPQTISQ